MPITRTLKLGLAGAAVVGGLCAVPLGTAQAATPDGVASIGSATIAMAGQADQLAAVAQCNVDTQPTSSASPSSITGVVSFGAGNTSCTRDLARNTTTSTATGTNFKLNALTQAGGPMLSITNFQVSCHATTAGTTASWRFSGMTGLGAMPRFVPDNYTRSIFSNTGQLLARAVFNEVTYPQPNDGSISLNMLHLKLFASSGATGDIIVGNTACSPTS